MTNRNGKGPCKRPKVRKASIFCRVFFQGLERSRSAISRQSCLCVVDPYGQGYTAGSTRLKYDCRMGSGPHASRSTRAPRDGSCARGPRPLWPSGVCPCRSASICSCLSCRSCFWAAFFFSCSSFCSVDWISRSSSRTFFSAWAFWASFFSLFSCWSLFSSARIWGSEPALFPS